MPHFTLKHSRVVDWDTPALKAAIAAERAADAVVQQAEFMRSQWHKALTTAIKLGQRMRAREEGVEE